MDTALRLEPSPANSNDQPEQQDAWRDHCLQMAATTEALAHWCDDSEMMNAYMALAGQWKAKASRSQPAGPR